MQIQDLALEFGSKLLFTDVNLNLHPGNRYALVGANGVGKSSFLKVLSGHEYATFGDVFYPKNSRIGILKQDHFLYENTLIINTVIAGRTKLWDALCLKEEILAKGEISNEDGYKLAEIEDIILEEEGYSAEDIAKNLLLGLGIKEDYHYLPLSSLSGGYKLRVLLAQSLFNNPEILLLDEPTNHLDINSIYWLENYLQDNFKGILVFISHDLTFLNNLATHILDIDYGEIRQYTGNYNNFIKQKEQASLLLDQQLVNVEKKIARMQQFVDRFKAKASKARQAQSRVKMIDKIELPDIKNSSRISPLFHFNIKRPSGKVVLKITELHKSFNDNQVLHNVNFSVNKQEKVILLGPNGVGKSTLLKILVNQLNQDKGQIEWGYETHVSYFAQDHHDLLRENLSILSWLKNNNNTQPETKLRSVLGNVLFKQDEVNQNILNLSGGEGARLLIAKIMLEEPNVILLDEPTNHLDIEAKESLKKALKEYKGTIIMVTHDRDFAQSIATRIIAISKKTIKTFNGNYNDYLKQNGLDYLKVNKTL